MNLNDSTSDSDISMVEEIVENYQPSSQEVRDYATYLGMNLPEDNKYLDISRAGLKAQLPPEWKVYQNKSEDIYYKNIKTGEVTYAHPLDEIYKQKFKEAKILDTQKKLENALVDQGKKTSKLKQIILDARDQQDQQDFQQIESNYVEKNIEKNIDEEITNMKENMSEQLNQMETALIEEANSDLNRLNSEYERKKELFQELQQKQKQIKLKVERELEEDYLKKIQYQQRLSKEAVSRYRSEKKQKYEEAVKLYSKRYSVYLVMKIILQKWKQKKPQFDKIIIEREFREKQEQAYFEENKKKKQQEILNKLNQQLIVRKNELKVKYSTQENDYFQKSKLNDKESVNLNDFKAKVTQNLCVSILEYLMEKQETFDSQDKFLEILLMCEKRINERQVQSLRDTKQELQLKLSTN